MARHIDGTVTVYREIERRVGRRFERSFKLERPVEGQTVGLRIEAHALVGRILLDRVMKLADRLAVLDEIGILLRILKARNRDLAGRNLVALHEPGVLPLDIVDFEDVVGIHSGFGLDGDLDFDVVEVHGLPVQCAARDVVARLNLAHVQNAAREVDRIEVMFAVRHDLARAHAKVRILRGVRIAGRDQKFAARDLREAGKGARRVVFGLVVDEDRARAGHLRKLHGFARGAVALETERGIVTDINPAVVTLRDNLKVRDLECSARHGKNRTFAAFELRAFGERAAVFNDEPQLLGGRRPADPHKPLIFNRKRRDGLIDLRILSTAQNEGSARGDIQVARTERTRFGNEGAARDAGRTAPRIARVDEVQHAATRLFKRALARQERANALVLVFVAVDGKCERLPFKEFDSGERVRDVKTGFVEVRPVAPGPLGSGNLRLVALGDEVTRTVEVPRQFFVAVRVAFDDDFDVAARGFGVKPSRGDGNHERTRTALQSVEDRAALVARTDGDALHGRVVENDRTVAVHREALDRDRGLSAHGGIEDVVREVERSAFLILLGFSPTEAFERNLLIARDGDLAALPDREAELSGRFFRHGRKRQVEGRARHAEPALVLVVGLDVRGERHFTLTQEFDHVFGTRTRNREAVVDHEAPGVGILEGKQVLPACHRDGAEARCIVVVDRQVRRFEGRRPDVVKLSQIFDVGVRERDVVRGIQIGRRNLHAREAELIEVVRGAFALKGKRPTDREPVGEEVRFRGVHFKPGGFELEGIDGETAPDIEVGPGLDRHGRVGREALLNVKRAVRPHRHVTRHIEPVRSVKCAPRSHRHVLVGGEETFRDGETRAVRKNEVARMKGRTLRRRNLIRTRKADRTPNINLVGIDRTVVHRELAVDRHAPVRGKTATRDEIGGLSREVARSVERAVRCKGELLCRLKRTGRYGALARNRRVLVDRHARGREGRIVEHERLRFKSHRPRREGARRDFGFTADRNLVGHTKRVRARGRHVAGHVHRRSRKVRTGDLKRTRLESDRFARAGTERVHARKLRIDNRERRTRHRQVRVREVDRIECPEGAFVDFDDVRIGGVQDSGAAERRFALKVERDVRRGRRAGVVVREIEMVVLGIARLVRFVELLDRDDVFRLVVTDVRNATLARQMRAPVLRARNVEDVRNFVSVR